MCWFPLCWLHCWPNRFSGCSTWNTSRRGPTPCTCWWTIWLIGFHCWWGTSCRFVFWHILSASRKWSWERRPPYQIWKNIHEAKALAAGLHNRGYGLATLELLFLGLFLLLPHWGSQTFFAVWLFCRWKSFFWLSIFSFLPGLSQNVKCLNDWFIVGTECKRFRIKGKFSNKTQAKKLKAQYFANFNNFFLKKWIR